MTKSKAEPVIASFDLGLHTGWAITQGPTRIASGTEHFKGKNWESRGVAYLRAGRFFTDIINQYDPQLICFEAVKRWMSSDASLTYGAILGQLLATAEDNLVPFIGFSPTEIKKRITGSGKASKDQMIAAITDLFSHVPSDDNEADSLAISILGRESI